MYRAGVIERYEETGRQHVTVDLCPACGVEHYDNTGPEAPGFAMVAGDTVFTQPNYWVRECHYCGLLYRSPRPTWERLSDYYRKADFRKWEIPGYFPPERVIISLIKELPKGTRVLDFGCSSGRLLQGVGPQYDRYGVEINGAAIAEAERKGLRILRPDELEAGCGKFDVILLVDIFEHLLQPHRDLEKLVRLLTKNGLLIVATGNGDAAACRNDPAQFWYFRTLEHTCMFTRRHADFIARWFSLQLERWIPVSHYDCSFRKTVFQTAKHFAYWQFRRNTLLARTVLRFVPRVRRARNWHLAQTYDCSRDHVVAVFRKLQSNRVSSLVYGLVYMGDTAIDSFVACLA